MIKKHQKRKGTIIPNLDLQYEWLNEYHVDSVELGRLCYDYPALKKSWSHFKTVYQMCKVEHEANREVSELVR